MDGWFVVFTKYDFVRLGASAMATAIFDWFFQGNAMHSRFRDKKAILLRPKHGILGEIYYYIVDIAMQQHSNILTSIIQNKPIPTKRENQNGKTQSQQKGWRSKAKPGVAKRIYLILGFQ